jgi:hypothetical protein
LFIDALVYFPPLLFLGLLPNLFTFFLDLEADDFLFDPLLEDEEADDDFLRLLLELAGDKFS